MIPKASQRGTGSELAAHLLNAEQNEYIEIADLRGSVADDLHGAFAEWEFQAHALTRCKNYLYSLSISPDECQGGLSRAQFQDFIDRVEKRLGLEGQPRAIVFHIKPDKDGQSREHAHVVWSRVDAANEKAVHMPFDHEKLMMVTREFACDHDLRLPENYFKEKGAKTLPQISLFEMAQERKTGLTRKDHQEQVTALWKASDSAGAFVGALADKGYLLATGNRPYVLVDFYGGMHALPRMLGVPQKQVEKLLGKDYPIQELPTVDEAKRLVGEYRKSIEAHMEHDRSAEEFARQRRQHAKRRESLEKERADLKNVHRKEMANLDAVHREARDALRRDYFVRTKQIEEKRYKPTGLAAFLGRVSGVELVRKKLHQYQDRKRLQVYMEKREELQLSQMSARDGLQRLQQMQVRAVARKLDNLKQIERKERKALEDALKKESRTQGRGKSNQMPSLAMGLTPKGRPAVPHKAKTRHYKPETVKEVSADALAGSFTRAAEPDEGPRDKLKGRFNASAGDGKEEGGKGSAGGDEKPPKQRARKPRKERNSRRERREEEKDERGSRRRRRDKDLDRGR